MAAVPASVRAPRAVPELQFAIEGCEALPYAATPTLSFALRLDAPAGHHVRAVLLDAQIQIAARRRGYERQTQERLLELFGATERWATTLRTLPWLRTTLVVPAFTGSALVELTVPVTYDLEVTGARYLAALQDGMVPLEFLFSGSVFYAGDGGMLQTARISWDHEVDYAMPVSAWREAMDRHFPSSAWLRLGRGGFDRLCAYKARHAFAGWDEAIDALLAQAGEPRP